MTVRFYMDLFWLDLPTSVAIYSQRNALVAEGTTGTYVRPRVPCLTNCSLLWASECELLIIYHQWLFAPLDFGNVCVTISYIWIVKVVSFLLITLRNRFYSWSLTFCPMKPLSYKIGNLLSLVVMIKRKGEFWCHESCLYIVHINSGELKLLASNIHYVLQTNINVIDSEKYIFIQWVNMRKHCLNIIQNDI